MSRSNGNETLSCSTMSVKSLLVVLGIVYLAVITTLANDQNTSKFKKVICTVFDNDFFANYSCRARPINRNTTILTLRGYLYRQVDDITVHIRMYKKYSGYKPFLINVKENFCDLFSKKSSVPYTRMFMKLAATYTNINHGCPFIGELYTRNASMDAEKLLDFWPSGEYRVDLTGFFNKRSSPSLIIQFFYEIGEKLFG